MAVQLKLILQSAPAIITGASKVIDSLSTFRRERKKPESGDSSEVRIKALEKAQDGIVDITEEQSRLIESLAEQNDQLAKAVDRLRKRVVSLSLIALLTALVSLLLVISSK